MFPQQPQQQFRTAGADVQMFYRSSAWAKPPGVSHVYMMLIGGGGNGDGVSSGGGSGAVTVWYGAAQHVPDSLIVSVSTGNAVNTTVSYKAGVSAAGITLLTANGGVTATAGTAMTANQFAGSGFFSSTAGQTGAGNAQIASTTTFLSSGARLDLTANYGYTNPLLSGGARNGFFQLQPIIVGAGGTESGRGPIGCGGGYVSVGGPGMALIASW